MVSNKHFLSIETQHGHQNHHEEVLDAQADQIFMGEKQ